MNRKLKKLLFKKELAQVEAWKNEQASMMRALSVSNFSLRKMIKKQQKQPINVLFACHHPALWSMFESIYRTMVDDPNFHPLVVSMPYTHGTLPSGALKDDGVFEFCEERNINVIKGYNKGSGEWIKPADLCPDYVFFQTPYDLFPPLWSVGQVSMLANICYIPYATCLFQGKVDDVLNPEEFFRYTYLYLKESERTKKSFTDRFSTANWFDGRKVVISGHPKLDYIEGNKIKGPGAWERERKKGVMRALWTPRWNTSEGCCHFFDYKDYFSDLCDENDEIDFVFRPHPLCLQNFQNTGELTAQEADDLISGYDCSMNRTLDRTGDYHDTFLTSDVLISDVSSMMLEYFATGKPIVYTHRKNVYNELGNELAEAFYWVRNVKELDGTLRMLMSGEDPLLEKRQELMSSLLFMPEGGAGLRIKDVLYSDFLSGVV